MGVLSVNRVWNRSLGVRVTSTGATVLNSRKYISKNGFKYSVLTVRSIKMDHI